MKRNSIISIIGLCCVVVLLLLSGCKKEEPETFFSDQQHPAWSIPSDYDVTSSMTAVIKVDLKAQYPDMAADFVIDSNDLLAAFAGETCLGTATPQDSLFFLYIAGQTTPTSTPALTLRYWSAHYKNLFEAPDAFPFTNDARLGTADHPFIPAFVVVK